MRLPPVEPRRLVAAPGGRHGDDREQERLEDLDRLLAPAALPAVVPVPVTEVMCDLAGSESLRHRGAVY